MCITHGSPGIENLLVKGDKVRLKPSLLSFTKSSTSTKTITITRIIDRILVTLGVVMISILTQINLQHTQVLYWQTGCFWPRFLPLRPPSWSSPSTAPARPPPPSSLWHTCYWHWRSSTYFSMINTVTIIGVADRLEAIRPWFPPLWLGISPFLIRRPDYKAGTETTVGESYFSANLYWPWLFTSASINKRSWLSSFIP